MGGRYFGNKKIGSSPIGRKKDSHVRNGPPTHNGRRSARTDQTFITYRQQYSSAAVRTAVHLGLGGQLDGWFLETFYEYETGNKQREFYFLTILGHLGGRASRHPLPTYHPLSTHGPTQYSST